MIPTACLLAIALTALSVAASPAIVRNSNHVTLPFTRRINLTGSHNLVLHDQARAKALRARAAEKLGHTTSHESRAVFNDAIDNQAVIYIATIGVGTPPTNYQLIVDTGSSNTWVGATQKYVQTSSSQRTANTVSVTYGSGEFSGTEFLDTVTLAPGLVIPGQSIGVAATSEGFAGVDGILGIGPTALTLATLSPATNATIPTVTDNAFALGLITANQVGVSFNPTSSIETLNGELTWGGVDSTKFTGPLNFAPITRTPLSSLFWGVNQSITYSTANTNILSNSAGIVDAGNTLLLLATDAFSLYQKATGGTPDATTGLLKFTTVEFANLKSLFFNINGVRYELTANAQIWPRTLNALIGGQAGNIYSIVNDLGTPSGEGLDFINGLTFLERFYTVYDTTNRRVGFATTPFTAATSN